MRRTTIVLLALALTAAACGSTVERADHGLAGRADDDASLNADGGSADETLATGDTRSGQPGASGSGGGRPAGARAGGVPQRGAVTTPIPAANGPGVTASTINVGVGFSTDFTAANAALGASGITQGDTQQMTKIIVDDINKNGGVAGRKLELVWHEYSNQSVDPTDVEAQRACDDYTIDHRIFLSMDSLSGREPMIKCLHERGVLTIDTPLTIADASTFRKYPYYVEIASLRLDRMVEAIVPALRAQGYLGGWDANLGQPAGTKPKIGIVTYDYPTFANAIDKILVPRLRAAGATVDEADVRKVTWLQSNADTPAVAAAVSSAVLRFRQDMVTHVFVVDERGLLTLLFLQEAQSQRFFPRYGFNTQNGPQALADGANLPKQQLVGSKGIGWLPQLDVSAADDTPTGPYSNEARRKCNELYRANGVVFDSRNAEAGALGICASFWFFRDVMNSVKGPVNREAFMSGVHRLGRSYVVPGIFGTNFSPTQHDGVGQVRHYGFDNACQCMRYTSGNVDIP